MRILKFFSAAGAEVVPDDTGKVTLADATVYYAELFDDMPDRTGYSIQWDYGAALVAAITIEATNRPGLSLYDTSSTEGWATTSATTISPAASAGTTMPHYADFMALRGRAKVNVTTGGTLRGTEHSKGRGAR